VTMRARWALRLLLAAGALVPPAGCTSFGAVRSARVVPGTTVNAQLSVATPPGEDAYWFWSLDCHECNRPMPAVDLTVSHGWTGGPRSARFSLGAGVSGVHPFVEGYVQAPGSEALALGAGVRLGGLGGWGEQLLFTRVDARLGSGAWLLLNPALFHYGGNSPNGENPGSFTALVQGIGLLLEGRRVDLAPYLSAVVGRGERESYGERMPSFSSTFLIGGVGFSWHRPRDRAEAAAPR
jgi:hypothetical protein